MDCRKTKLYHFVELLDSKQLRDFKKFLQSPYFSSSEDLLVVYQAFEDHIKKQTPTPLDSTSVWKKVKKKAPYNDTRFRKYCSDLFKLGEKFLVIDSLLGNELNFNNLLIDSILEAKGQKFYPSFKQKAQKSFEEGAISNSIFYLEKYKFQAALYELEGFETRRSEKSNIEEISNNIDIFYISEKLKWLCMVSVQSSFAKIEYQIDFQEEILQFVRSKIEYFEGIPVVAMYYYLYMNLKDRNSDVHFDKLRDLIHEHIDLFPPKDALDIFHHAQNICLYKLNRGKSEFSTHYFDISKMMIESNLIQKLGFVTQVDFRNIVTIALRLGKYEWVKSFIEEYKEFLPPDSKASISSYSLGLLFFYQKDYSSVIEQLQNVDYDDLAFTLNAKIILTAAYYELDEIEVLLSHMSTFQTYLNRHKDIPESRRRPYLELIRYTRKLIRILPNDHASIGKIKSEIIERRSKIANANWLLEKIAEIQGEPAQAN